MLALGLGSRFVRSLARAGSPLVVVVLLASACGSSKTDFNDPGGQGATGGTGGTGSGTLSTLLARCNGLCDKAATEKCGNDAQGCHTSCSDSLDQFKYCTDVYDALLACAEALSSICPLYAADAPDPVCDKEIGDYTHCASVCSANPSDAICQ